jgi:hypothetical protein
LIKPAKETLPNIKLTPGSPEPTKSKHQNHRRINAYLKDAIKEP